MNFTKDIKQLEYELSKTRELVLDLLPDGLSMLLRSYHSWEHRTVPADYADAVQRMRDCFTADGWGVWHARVVEEVINVATVLPSGYQDVARCPLCDDRPQNNYAEGFTHPEGLRRHLHGTHRSHECPVMEAARHLARDYEEMRREWQKKGIA